MNEKRKQHTPGPWKVERVAKPTRHYAVEIPGCVGPEHPGDRIIVGEMGGDDEVHATDAANARLIAAAPELLEALRELAAAASTPVRKRGEVTGAHPDYAKAILRTALVRAGRLIAKATGGES